MKKILEVLRNRKIKAIILNNIKNNINVIWDDESHRVVRDETSLTLLRKIGYGNVAKRSARIPLNGNECKEEIAKLTEILLTKYR